MLTASPSPRLNPSPQSDQTSSFNPPRHRYDTIRKPSISSSPIAKPYSTHVDAPSQSVQAISQWSRDNHSSLSASTNIIPPPTGRRNMVDAGTQYSPPPGYRSPSAASKYPVVQQPQTSQLKLADTKKDPVTAPDAAMPRIPIQDSQHPAEQTNDHLSGGKRAVSITESTQVQKQVESMPQQNNVTPDQDQDQDQDQGPSKRARGEIPPVKIMPIKYETCDTRELVILISSMLMELIRYNDAIPLKDGHLTRFHSRAPPGISVQDYLQRLTTHATLPPPILLSMVYYIDKLCQLYPAFTISSLTVHRFLITSATVASKGLSDSFWTNKTYARVGGVSVKELALLEMEFLIRVQWRIVPQPEVLIDYYRSLVERSPGHEIEQFQAT